MTETQIWRGTGHQEMRPERMPDEIRAVQLDHPPNPRVRYGFKQPPHPALARILRQDGRYQCTLRHFLPLVPSLCAIRPTPDNATEPHWINDWFVGLDAVALYGFIATRRPRRYIEIGSGTSTKFARRAISDHSPRTTIISIDPNPRSEIDAICDEVIRLPLEDVAAEFFASLRADDILFFDGSHRAFQNSDVTVFFTEILPGLPRGMLVGVHDIFLPHDYPVEWHDRLYSEQYLLACWLLAGDRLRPELPVYHCAMTPALHSLLWPLWCHPHLAAAYHGGGAFWFTFHG
jgi:hypothetical protein